ncbi:hypothetical protein Pla110_08750 [Polystyrenella longa]|uniref:Uncharacterized protein n=2 Tax=Polystyrenella longa TaxID=2528007 RepID=A0A518CIX3_9PLAN|nr:hypothetical protein Pla110_08750 [Polystyrenella longa]
MTILKHDELGFEANYAVRESSAQQSAIFQRYIFDRQRSEAKPDELQYETWSGGSLVLEVYPPAGDPWIGHFRSGRNGINGVFGTPSPDVVCVVAEGQGYLIPVSQPDQFIEIQSSPMLHIFSIPSCQLICFGDFTVIEAYGPKGRVWMTEQLSWDGLEIIEATEIGIRGNAWDAPANKYVKFIVDPSDGTHVGGARPDRY